MFLRTQGSNLWIWVERGRQLFGEILVRKRVPPKNRFPNDSQKQQQSFSGKLQNVIAQPENQRLSGSIFARFNNLNTQAALLRRFAVKNTPVGRQHFVGFAFLGLALANEGQKGNGNINLMPLDVCCEVIKNTFQKTAVPNHLDLPSDLSSYELSPQLLGKGCNASIYAARVKNNAMPEEDEDDLVVVPMETSDDVSDASGMSDDGEESEDGFVFVNTDVEGLKPQRELPVKPEGQFGLAIKMMFNYDVLSNAIAINRAFEKEYLPLQQEPNELHGSTMLQWQNGNHVKKKKSLSAHPNIIAMYHVFAAPVDVHDIAEAKELFPAALPRRIHSDGMGRNMTMFIVMKRYDMTLTEYLRSIGCPSQRVAMVIVAQLLEGVSHLTANGIAHRDLKGNNILVNVNAADGGSPHVVLADFGCCLADDNVGLVLPYPSQYTCIGGNTALMAPEIKQTEPGPGRYLDYSKSDAWSIGAIAYEVMGHKNPFYRQRNQPGLDSGLYDEKDLPSLADSDNHPALAKVVRMLLRKDPSKRPTSQVAADMLHLSLWQPEWWKNACWQFSHLIPTKHHITNWLLHVSMATMDSSKSALVQNSAEKQLIGSWLGRVNEHELVEAMIGLYGIWQ